LLPDDDERALRVTFNEPCIIRILDEMALGTEKDGPTEGLVPNHFAYRVEDQHLLMRSLRLGS
jgi:hypothetical protein